MAVYFWHGKVCHLNSLAQQTTVLMKTFIENYLLDPSQAIAGACNIDSWADSINDNTIYEQLASPEFRLYEEIILS